MARFFRISGVIFFLGCVIGFVLMFGSAGSGSLGDMVVGALLTFASIAIGLLFIYCAELLERIARLENELKSPKNKELSISEN